MITYRTALPSEREACLSLANQVFSRVSYPHDFAALLPKVYGPDVDSAQLHFLAVDDEQGIRGLVATLPGTLWVNGAPLKTGYIGTVCVHPEARGEGHMKKLMRLNMDRMLQNGTDIAMLGGQRQRYSYFGYESGGVRMTAVVSKWAVRHALSHCETDDVTFQEMQPGADMERQAAALHQSQAMYASRAEFGFVTAACSYNHKPYAALQNGRLLGYVIAGKDPAQAAEVLADTPEHLDSIIKGWIALHQLTYFSFPIPGWNIPMIEHVWDYAESMQASSCIQVCILRYAPVVRALLDLKSRYAPLADGVLELEADGQAFTVTVKDNRVQAADGANHPQRFSHRDMQRLLTDPFYFSRQSLAPGGWFPLPLFMSEPDEF